MRMVNGTLMLDFPTLIQAGISEHTLRKASHRGSVQWPFVKDDSDQRRLLIAYDKLAEKYRDMVRRVFGNPYEYVAYQVLTPYLSCPDKDREFINSYCDHSGRMLSEEFRTKYITACAYLNLFDFSKAQYKALGFSNRDAFESAVVKLIKANDVSLPTHPKSLCRKLSEYRANGTIAVINKQHSNDKAVKLGEVQQRWLMSAYADPRKLSVELIYQQFLLKAQQESWPIVCLSTVKAYLAKASVRQAVSIERDPKIWKDKFGLTITTQKPSQPDALWEGDGTKLNLFYLNDDGKLCADIVMYAVVDIYSETFIGVSFAKSENSEVVKSAWRMAAKVTGRIARQSRFDNGGPHRSAEVQAFMKYVSDVHFESTAYSGQSKYIEGIFGRFQNTHLRLFPNFTGMNIRTKKDDSRMNESFVKANKNRFPDYNRCIAQCLRAMEAWNNSANKRGKIRSEIYKTTSAGRLLQEQDRINLFYIERPNSIMFRKDGLELVHQGERMMFDVYKNDTIDLDFHLNYTNEKFKVRFNPEDLSHVYLYDDNQRMVGRADAKVLMPGALSDATEGSRIALNRLLELKKQQVTRLSDLITEVKQEHQVNITHSSVFKDALNDAETNFLISETNDAPPVLRKASKSNQTFINEPFISNNIDDVFNESEIN